MLKNIDPLLSSDMLYALNAMGHGDTLVIVDAGFPTTAKAGHRHISMPGNSASDVLEAVLTVLPLDTFTPCPMKVMKPENSDVLPEAAEDFVRVLRHSEELGQEWEAVDRFSFYDVSEKAQLIISTADTRPYACLALVKGLIF